MAVLAHLAAALGYAVFAGLLAFLGVRSWLKAFLVLAATMTSAWMLSVALAGAFLAPERLPAVLGPLTDGAWFTVVLVILHSAGRDQDQTVWRALALVTAAVIAAYVLLSGTQVRLGNIFGIILDVRAAGIVTTILGIVLVENMLRNLSHDQFWATKLLGIGLFGILVLELLTRLPEFLTNTPSDDFLAARPLVLLLILPLFVVSAARNPELELRVHSSRSIVFRTSALIATGILLQGTALAAYYVRTYGGSNAAVLSIVLGFSGVVAAAVAIASHSVRSRLRLFINENFFSYKYDYRLEWEKFIRALSAHAEGDIPLRVLRTLAELLDSPGGALWVWRDRWQQFMPVANWSFRSELAPLPADDPALAAFADENCVFLELLSPDAKSSALNWHQRYEAAWLAVPLRYRSALVGIALINRPRVDRTLDWEDKNLIALVALQLAAYLVQEETAQALADARQLEEFNKRFAFILHDTKNTIGQLSLLVRNAEQFGHDEEFRKDMIVTLRHSVEKLQELLAQLKGTGNLKPKKLLVRQSVDAVALVTALVEDKRRIGLNVVMEQGQGPVFAELGDKEAFLGVLEHVLTNAIEATPKDASAHVRVGASGSAVRVWVEDRGRGMTPQFIADELFRPLRSTKERGFGIGAYQAREIMRELGGDIDVRSKVGEGTTIILSLPAAVAEKEVARA